MITLTKDQQTVADNIVEFYKTSGERIFLLQGHAGTGKSTLIAKAVEQLRGQYPRLLVAVAAPTNKAVRVVRQMADDVGIEAYTATIHSLLGMSLNAATGEEKFLAKVQDGHFSDFDLVIVDEVSMCTNYVFSVIKEMLGKCHTKVIFMGDRAQLPPVKEKESPAFTGVDREGVLTQILRQQNGNPILQLSENLRKSVNTGYPTKFVTDVVHGTGVHVVNAATWNEWIAENFTSDEYANDPNAFRALAWTNDRVKYLNKRIRTLLLGKTETPYVTGERLFVRQPIAFPDSPDEFALKTDEECTVLNIFEDVNPTYPRFKCWSIDIRSDRDIMTTAYLLHADSIKDYNDELERLKNAALRDGRQWRQFHWFKDSFADVQPPHALTVHKSQGSTYGNVFVDLLDISRNKRAKEKWQLLYVACSRARENVVIMDRVK